MPILTVGTTNDDEFDQLGSLGYTGTINDRQFDYLGALGFTGTLTDRLNDFSFGVNNIQITTAAYLDTALLRVGDVISGAYVAGVYPDFNGTPVSESLVRYFVDDVEVASSYVLQSGDLVGQALITLTAGIAQRTYYSAISGVTDFSITPTDLEWTVPPGAGAPVLSSPADAANGSTAGTGSVSTDQATGTLYWVCTTSLTAPTQAQVKAGQDHTGTTMAAGQKGSQAVSGTGTQNLSPAPSGLTAGSTYIIHFMHENASALQSNVASGDGFTTTTSATISTHGSLTTSLISYWKLEEASGTRADSHGTNTLSDNNTVTQTTGKIGNAALFTAANSEYLNIVDASQTGLDLTGSLSFNAWYKPTTNPTTVDILSKWNTTGNQRSYIAMIANSGAQMRLLVSSNGTYQAAGDKGVTITTLTTGTWYMLTWVFDASTGVAEFFVNGASQGTQTAYPTSVFNSTAGFRLSSNTSAGEYANGAMDEVGVWSKVLTGTEITDLYQSGNGLPYN